MVIKKIENLSPSELDQIVNLHSTILVDSFINNFGNSFLKKFYLSLASQKDAIFYTVKKNDRVVGFLVATTNGEFFNGKIITKNFINFTRSVLVNSLNKPSLVIKVIIWLLLSLKPTASFPELKLIAIDTKLQGQGIGTKLLKKLNEEYKIQKINQFIVGTKSYNKLSNSFYIKKGFEFTFSKNIFGESFNFYFSKMIFPNEAKSQIISKKNWEINNILYKTLLITFLLLFIFKSFSTMARVPFHDFDEAHRAENARRMKEYQSYFVPLTGSSFDRIEGVRIPLKNDPTYHLYFHLERPFLVYLSMILTTSIFGESEFGFRIASFILGILCLLVFYIFSKKTIKNNNPYKEIGTIIGLTTLICSTDLWLSSQYAQLDTGITLFLFISLLSIIYYLQSKIKKYLIISSLSFALAVLSKGQPAIIFIFPLIYLTISKKLLLKDLIIFSLTTSIILVPWLLFLVFEFGFFNFIKAFSGFALYSASVIDIHQVAPVFWYIRWLWEAFRPGWTIFLALFLYDLIFKNLNWQKKVLLFYIFGGLFSFSIPINKIWWYILPLIPAISFYIFLSTVEYLKRNSHGLLNISVVFLLASLPILLRTTNTYSLIYGIVITIISFVILNSKINTPFKDKSKYLLALILLFSLTFFYWRFPAIRPYHWNTKAVSLYYKSLPGKKCLWIYNMPTEAALFYSNAGETPLFNGLANIYGHCQNYLISPENLPDEVKNKSIIFQKGKMKLIEL